MAHRVFLVIQDSPATIQEPAVIPANLAIQDLRVHRAIPGSRELVPRASRASPARQGSPASAERERPATRVSVGTPVIQVLVACRGTLATLVVILVFPVTQVITPDRRVIPDSRVNRAIPVFRA